MFEILQFIKKAKNVLDSSHFEMVGWGEFLGDCFDITRYLNITTSISVLEYCFSNTETLK